MRISRLVALVGVVILSIAAATGARGQTGNPPSPTPTPVPTTTLPDGQTLVNAATAKVNSEKTVHVKLDVSVTLAQLVTSEDKGTVDTRVKPYRLHEKDTVKTTDLTTSKTTVQHTETIDVGTKEATRTGKKKWKCTAGTGGTTSDTNVTTTYTTLGTDTVNSTPVYHVQEVDTFTDLSPPNNVVKVDYYISQANNEMLHESVDATLDLDTGAGVVPETISGTEDFSKYGESLKVKLPAACVKKKKLASSVFAMIVQNALSQTTSAARIAVLARHGETSKH